MNSDVYLLFVRNVGNNYLIPHGGSLNNCDRVDEGLLLRIALPIINLRIQLFGSNKYRQ